MADWSFRSRQGLCAACGRGFVEGEAVFSMLRLIEDELQRGDLCSNCFDRRDEASDLIWWRTAHQEKKGGLRMDFDGFVFCLAFLPVAWSLRNRSWSAGDPAVFEIGGMVSNVSCLPGLP